MHEHNLSFGIHVGLEGIQNLDTLLHSLQCAIDPDLATFSRVDVAALVCIKHPKRLLDHLRIALCQQLLEPRNLLGTHLNLMPQPTFLVCIATNELFSLFYQTHTIVVLRLVS